jgi:transposase
MGRALSLDLRQRIIAAWQNQEGTWKELADRFGVGEATVDRLVARFRERGSVAPDPHGGGQPALIPDEQLPVVRRLLDAAPDITVAELAARYRCEVGLRVSRSTMSRTVARLGYTRKKRPLSAQSATARASRRSGKRS